MKKQTACLCLLLIAFIGSGARAETPPHIESVHIGLPAGDSYRSRSGAWAPVYVKLKAGAEGNPADAFHLAVETTDGEDVPYRYPRAVPALAANEERTVLTYVRPGTEGSDFTIDLLTGAGKSVQSLRRPARDAAQQEVVGPNTVFTLVLSGAEGEHPVDKREDNSGRVNAHAKSVAVLPDHWLGYDGVDVVVLATGDSTFVSRLLDDSAAPQREALLQWVQRGGRLILSVGHNPQLVSRLLKRMPLIACTIKGKEAQPSLAAVRDWAGRDVRQSLNNIDLAQLQPGAETSVLLREHSPGVRGNELPLLVEGSCGRGRVVLVAFDLDVEPFTTWEGQPVFVSRLLNEVGPRLQRTVPGGDSELASELKRGLETFAEVPMISFGWVAVLILLYIVVIGPLDYLLLKKLFNRLELTWLTFPVVVLTVSVAAYFTASYLKGDELRINKVDFVDLDLHGAKPQVHGTSWFTLFSPHVQSFTIGLSPDESGWLGSSHSDSRVVVGPMDEPERAGKRSAHSLFHRPYQYTTRAAGLEHMPVPIWATRTFQASWQGSAQRPPIEAKLSLSRDGQAVVGSVINHLPVELQGITLFYHGKWYRLPNLVPEEWFRVERLFDLSNRPHDVSGPHDVSQWFQEWNPKPATAVPLETQVHGIIKPLLFHTVAEGPSSGNSHLRFLDESWRLKQQGRSYREEVILVAHTAPRTGQAEDVTTSGAAPSQLWLDALPGAGSRPKLSGAMNQVTYVRAFVPVAPASRPPAEKP